MTELPKLSICIPTFERPVSLHNCLESIANANLNFPFNFEVCISDNSESDSNIFLIDKYSSIFTIKYFHNPKNLGYAANFINCVSMATGKFAWLVGDDDLIMPTAFEQFVKMQLSLPEVNFFYVNAFNLDRNFLEGFGVPFDTRNLPKNLSKFSNYKKSKELKFRNLIQSKYSFDFLGGMFLSIFNRQMWVDHKNCISPDIPGEVVKFNNIDNTFPHTKILANTFMGERAYYSAEPLIVAVGGVRDWTRYYPLIRTFRFLDLLQEFRLNGLGWLAYQRNKNASIKHLAYDCLYYFENRDETFPRIEIYRYIFANLLLPNLYYSVLRLIAGRVRQQIKRILG